MEANETVEQQAHDQGLRLRMRGEEHRTASQHEQLNELCREALIQIDQYGASGAINDFLLFMTALDAHMTVEEDIFFLALHGLCGDASEELTVLVAEHNEFRRDLDEIRILLKAKNRVAARLALGRLARQISKHERAEEDLIARITEGPISQFGNSNLDG
jgi:hypothetical protein